MGTTVLDPGPSPSPDVQLFAHDLRGGRDQVALLVLNADEAEAYDLETDRAVARYTLAAPDPSGTTVELNGRELAVSADGTLPEITGAREPAGKVSAKPRTITFLTTAA